MNLKRDEINCFGAETDPNRSWTCDLTWAKSFKLKDELENQNLGKISHFSTGKNEIRESEREMREHSKLLFMIDGVPLVGISQAKN